MEAQRLCLHWAEVTTKAACVESTISRLRHEANISIFGLSLLLTSGQMMDDSLVVSGFYFCVDTCVLQGHYVFISVICLFLFHVTYLLIGTRRTSLRLLELD